MFYVSEFWFFCIIQLALFNLKNYCVFNMYLVEYCSLAHLGSKKMKYQGKFSDGFVMSFSKQKTAKLYKKKIIYIIQYIPICNKSYKYCAYIQCKTEQLIWSWKTVNLCFTQFCFKCKKLLVITLEKIIENLCLTHLKTFRKIDSWVQHNHQRDTFTSQL